MVGGDVVGDDVGGEGDVGVRATWVVRARWVVRVTWRVGRGKGDVAMG